MPADGGEARRLTDFADGVEDFVWSPDGKQLAVIAIDPEFPPDAEKPKNPPPIVTERYQFKEDGSRLSRRDAASTSTCSTSPAARPSC